MGRMKDLYIDKLNEERNGPDDTDWNYNEPQPIAIQNDGKKCWEVKSSKDDATYKIWAFNYQQALDLLPMIESF